MDLAAAIIMFEKPMGIWAILGEESLFPKATDKSFEEKLKASLGKLPVFLKPQSKTDKNAHFAISHYAGIVSYNVTGWLDKNKDPVNDSVVELMKSTSQSVLLVHLWRDHPGQPTTAPKDEGKKKKKGGGGKTVSSVYLVSLTELMSTLHNCEPHFVRCLVPNTHKKPGEVEPPLIMHQLTCNGVLEGIRICMRGFPNRMLYPDFKLRYSCLGQDAIKSSEDNKTAVYALMDGIPFDRERYRLGHTLVFFRAGSLGGLEEERDKLVIKWVRFIQGEVLKRVRGFVYQKKFDQRELIKVGQRNFRKYLASRDWGWFVLIQKTRGLIGMPNPEEELRLLEEKANATGGKYQEALQVTANLNGSMDTLKDEIKAMGKQLAEEQGNISVYTDRQAKATATKATAECEVKAHSGSVGVVKKEIEDIELAIAKVELEKGNRDHTIKVLQDEISEQDEVINKLNKEKKHIAETQAKSNDDMITVNEKVVHLNSVKSKLESTLDELEGGLDKEKKSRASLEKQKRKVEGDLKMSQDGVAELERAKRDLEVTINNKDKNNAQLAAKLDDEQNLVAKAQKGIKEIQGRVEAMEEELEAERQARAKAERQRSDLAREIDSLGERLDEASGATTAQVELNKKRDA